MTGTGIQTRNYGRKSSVPCKCGNIKCGGDVDKEAICCDACDKWYHNKCSRLDSRALSLYVTNKCLKWVCFQCIAQVRKQAQAEQIKQETPLSRMDKATDCSDLHQDRKDRTKQEGEKVKRPEFSQRVSSIQATNTKKVRNASKSGGNTKQTVLLKTGTLKGDPKRVTATQAPNTKRGHDEGAPSSKEDRTTIGRISEMVRAQGEAIRALEREKAFLSQSIHHLRTSSDLALGRNRNVVIKGVPEPFMKERRQRERAVGYHLNNLLRTVGLLGVAKIKRTLRLGKWKPDSAPRPVCVEFANPRMRDKFLALAGEIARRTERRFLIEPDDSAGWRKNITSSPQQEVRAKLEVRATKLLEKPTNGEPNRPDHTQGSLDGWIMVKPRRAAAKNGVCPRT